MSRHDPGEEIVSPLNGVGVGLWLLTIPAVGIIIRYVDLLDGRASIPLLFYGIFVLALLMDGLEFLWPGPYLRTCKDELRIGPRVRIARDEITHVGVERNWLGLRRICVMRVDGRRWCQKAFLFARLPDEMVTRIHEWASATRPL